MRRAKADTFESASIVAKAAPFQAVTPLKIKKADRYWSAPPSAKRPVIPIAEIGYVRRSAAARLAAIPVSESLTNRGVQSLL
jgi:hypothetical protein